VTFYFFIAMTASEKGARRVKNATRAPRLPAGELELLAAAALGELSVPSLPPAFLGAPRVPLETDFDGAREPTV